MHYTFQRIKILNTKITFLILVLKAVLRKRNKRLLQNSICTSWATVTSQKFAIERLKLQIHTQTDDRQIRLTTNQIILQIIRSINHKSVSQNVLKIEMTTFFY